MIRLECPITGKTFQSGIQNEGAGHVSVESMSAHCPHCHTRHLYDFEVEGPDGDRVVEARPVVVERHTD